MLREAGWIVLLGIGAYLALILASYHRTDPGPFYSGAGGAIANKGGALGAWISELLLYLFGFSAWLFVALAGYGILRLYRALLALRREMHRRRPAAEFAISAVDDRTIAVASGAYLVVVRLGGAATVDIETLATCECGYSIVLTTEDGAFGGDGQVPQLRNDRRAIEFAGPAAIVLKHRASRGKEK